MSTRRTTFTPPPRPDSETRELLERHLVGGLLAISHIEPGLAADVVALCPAGSVVSPRLCDIWDAVVALQESGMPVDLESVWDAVHTRYMRRESPRDADAAHLAELTLTPFATREAVLSFADNLAAMLRRHRMADVLRSAAADCLVYGEDPDEIARRVVRALQDQSEPVASATLAPLLEAVIRDVERGEGARPMPTPWPTLHAVLKGGAAPGELVVLAGRPGLGKTALAGCWAVETARRFGSVLFVSCEVKDKTLGARLLAREGHIDNRAFRQGLGNSAAALPRIRDAASCLADLPLCIVDSSCRAVRPAEVRKQARRLKGGPALVVVDYLQLMYPDDKHDSREREIADMSRAMKRLAVELDCPVLLLSQLNRKAEEGNREPQLSDLRESGAVEQDADIVIMLHSEKRHMIGERCPVKALVRKGRSSGTGTAMLLFDKAHSDFAVDESGEAWRKQCEVARAANDL